MNEHVFVYALLGALNIFQGVLLQKLTNKLMSRTYHEYEFAKNVSRTMDPPKQSLADGLKEQQDLKEDLSPVEHFVSGVF